MFDCGIMDLFQKLQELLNKIYIRHRDYDDLKIDKLKSKALAEEIRTIAEELPQYKIVFLTPTSKDALLRFSTWVCALLNYMDTQPAKLTDSLVYAMPTLLIDIPFEVLRALKRSN